MVVYDKAMISTSGLAPAPWNNGSLNKSLEGFRGAIEVKPGYPFGFEPLRAKPKNLGIAVKERGLIRQDREIKKKVQNICKILKLSNA